MKNKIREKVLEIYPKAYVKLFTWDSFCGKNQWRVWEHNDGGTLLGVGDSPEKAWEDAYNWIKYDMLKKLES
jgi:hypothetical protein